MCDGAARRCGLRSFHARFRVPRSIFLAVALLSFASSATAALVVTDQNNGVTAQAMATALVGSGVTISNVTYTGSPRAAGGFSGGSAIVGVATGIILSSGNVQTLVDDPLCSRGVEGPNGCNELGGLNGYTNSTYFGTAGDADLQVLAGFPTYDAAILEFDFVPEFPNVQFQYVFSSDEYSDYSNTSFNDVFGFFINGQNCALVPGTGEPVSINTINNGNDVGGDTTPHNPLLFLDNVRPSPSIDTEMDGLSVVLTCTATVNVGVTNHMKLATADASDGDFDTAVFIQAGSLVSVPCGNGMCESSDGESCVNCPADCGSCCGNGTCDSGESTAICPADCIPPCGNGTCEGDETCTSCPGDCGLCFCGNATCDPSETCAECPGDCPCEPVCGDGQCAATETCTGCPADCGPCPPVCGNGVTEAGEQCDDGGTLSGDGCSANCQTEGACLPDCGTNGQKVTICHAPPGNPTKPVTICIAVAGLSGHANHAADRCGPCGVPGLPGLGSLLSKITSGAIASSGASQSVGIPTIDPASRESLARPLRLLANSVTRERPRWATYALERFTRAVDRLANRGVLSEQTAADLREATEQLRLQMESR
jgi:cysteine-rich repeat protein